MKTNRRQDDAGPKERRMEKAARRITIIRQTRQDGQLARRAGDSGCAVLGHDEIALVPAAFVTP
jgi:hypothetical protein